MEATTISFTDSRITFANRVDHASARLGIRRNHHRVQPGLYSVGSPTEDSPVLVSANYTLSFDALRSSLSEIDAFILVLDTKGINVWCAAGKGSFGTDELVRRIEAVGLKRLVNHRRLILPQLGAPGIAAHEVRERSGFRVEFGPVDAADLPEYLHIRKATPAMRRVNFGISARSVLIPVEAVHIVLPVVVVSLALRLTGLIGHFYNVALAGVLAGVVLFPLLLPWIPTQDFSTKGFLVGVLAWVPILIREILQPDGLWWRTALVAFGSLLVVTAISSFLSLNFTGSTSFTSRSGVRKEIFRYIPAIAWIFGVGVVLSIVMLFV